MATPVQSTAPVETQCAEQVVGKDIKCKCLNDREQGHGGRGAEPSEEAGDAVAPEPVVMPFESFSADGSLPSRPLSFIQETYEMRYIADYPSPGDDMWAYFHPNNVVVIGLTVLHRALCNEARTGALGLQNGTGGAGNKESATTPHKRIEVRYSQFDGKALEEVRDNGGKMQKKTGVWVKSDTTICTIGASGSDDAAVECMACLKGKFLAANKALCGDSSIILRRPHDEGFLCILCLYAEDREKGLKQMLTREQYCELRGVALEVLQ